ncbi:MAG TPA: glycosyl hydrolase family 28-related protein [Candidatus Saccharimonadales bacterium]|nr:glycosyl hydrolase family 28-related protein [Candidatus Saccharimonadales bacterium]
MARLPTPGADDNVWGQLLNDFLSVELNTDGTLKRGAEISGAYQKPSGGIPKTDLDSSVQTSLGKADVAPTALSQLSDVNTAGVANSQVLGFDTPSGKWIPATVSSSVVGDATTGSKGIVQLAGDLAGVATSPTVPGLAGKVDKTSFTAKGDMLAGTGSGTLTKQAAGTNGQVLTADSTQTTGIKWAAATDSSAVHKGDLLYNIVDYGATTGATDNKTAIDAAITAAAVTGGVVYVPGGTWKTTGQHTIPLNVSVRGAGKGVTTVSFRGVGTYCFFIGSNSGGPNPPNYMGRVGEFSLQGQSSGNGTGPWGQQVGIYVLNCLFFNLQDIHMSSIYKAFYIDGGDEVALGAGTFAGNGYVSNCTTANVFIGFHIYRWVTDTAYNFIYSYGNSPITTGSVGIWFDTKPTTSTLFNPSVEGHDTGIRVSTSRQGLAFINPRLENCTTYVLWENNTWGHVILGGSEPPNGPWASGSNAGSVTHIARDGWFPTVTSLPSASSSYRNAIYRITGGTGVTDGVFICIKDSTDTYVWRELTAAQMSFGSYTTKGDLVVGTGASAATRVGVGSDGTILTADSTKANGVSWSVHALGGGNYITNPSFLDGNTGWTAGGNCTLSANTLNGLFDANCGSVARTASSGTGTVSIISPRSTVLPSLAYSASGSFRLGTLGTSSARSVTLQVNWYDAVNTLISSQTSSAVNESIQGTWSTIALPNVIAPDTAAKAEVQVNVASVPEGESHYFDGFQLEPGTLPTSFNANFAQSSLNGNMLAPATITSRETATGSAKPLYGTTAAMPPAGTAGRMYWATDTNGLYFDNGTSWVVVNASGSASLDGMYDFPFTYDPRAAGSTSSSALGFTTNNVYYFRLQGAATINGLMLHQLGVGSGDGSGKTVNLALYNNTGSGRSAKPSTKISGSDLSITPGASAGDLSANFTGSITVSHGMWVGFSTTLSSASSLSRNSTSNVSTSTTDGLSWVTTTSGTGPTLPSTAPALSSFYLTLLVVGI